MFICLRLLLSHFIADFPLQFSGVYNLKLKHTWGSFIHSGIVVLVCIIMNIPFLKYPEMWVIIFWVWLIHGLQDWAKVTYCEKIKKDNLWIFILDQLLHMALISVIMLVPKLSQMTAPAGESFILKLYNNNHLIIALMGYIFSGFGGVFVNLYMKESFMKVVDLDIPGWKEKYFGIFERILITMLIVVGGYWFLLLLPYAGIRIALAKKRNKEFYINLAINAIIALTVGLLVTVFIP